jgi:anti-sigma factor RsiW
MKHETFTVEPEDPHRECWDLLPWLANGRLAPLERTRIEAHLAGCAACRDELAAQRELRERMLTREPLATSPTASFEKLWSRIEELEREVPAGGGPEDEAAQDEMRQHDVAPSEDETQVARPRTPAPRGGQVPLARWLVAAVVVQAIALAWLASVLFPRASQDAWPYRTVTSAPVPAAGVPHVRVVFARDATIEDVQQMLGRRGLVIVSGPSAADVFIVAAGQEPRRTAGEIVAQLREDPLVRFVERAGPAP